MKKITIYLAVVLFVGFGVLFAHAQNTQPPGFDFPTLDETATATIEATATATTVFVTVTPTTVSAQTATDDAETGPEVYILIGLSLLGGLGIFSIKKYFDLKKYTL